MVRASDRWQLPHQGAWLLCLLALVLLSSRAQAQPPQEASQAAAQVLFESGRALMKAGRFAEACPKFAESQRLAPALGTRFNLAECYEQTGRLASAWVHFVGVADAAARTSQPQREAYARERAERLQPRLSRLQIVVEAPPQGLVVTRDGVAVGAVQWGEPLPVDAGSHRVEASAPGYRPWSGAIDIIGEGTLTTLRIPTLIEQPRAPELAPPAPMPASTPAAPAPAAAPVPVAPPQDAAGLHPLQIGALVAGGAGLVGLGLGTGFGILAKTRKDRAAPHCPRADACFAEGAALIEEAQTAASVSTASFAIGGALAATGLVLWLVAPSPVTPSPAAPSPATSQTSASRTGLRVALAPTRQGAAVSLRGVW